MGTTPASSGLYNNSRETSPYSEFVNNGPTRIAMPYRVPDPVMPPWVTSTASVTSSTEHVYAVPARVIRSSEESVGPADQRDPRSVGSLVSLNAQWKGANDQNILQQHHQPLLHHHQYHHHQQCNTSPRPYLPNTRTLLCDTTEESAAATSTTS